MDWIGLALLTALFFGFYNFFIKLSSGHIHEIAGAVVLQVVAAILGGVILVWLRMAKSPLEISARGVWFAVLAGLFVGLAEILSFFVFSRGVSASAGIPVIVGGTVVTGVVLGAVFLGESLRPTDYLAVALIIAGIVLLGGR